MTLVKKINSVEPGSSSIADALRSMSSLIHGEKSDEEQLMCNSSEMSDQSEPTTPENSMSRKNSNLRFKTCDVTIINMTKSKDYLNSLGKYSQCPAEWEVPEQRSIVATVCLVMVLTLIAILAGIVIYTAISHVSEDLQIFDNSGLENMTNNLSNNLTDQHRAHLIFQVKNLTGNV